MNIDWEDYARVHAGRSNLLIHVVAVPLFAVSFVLLVVSAWRGGWTNAAIAGAFAVLAMALQGRGHRLERLPPRPFTGPADFFRRWFTEQFFIFPVFFLSGRWWRQYRASGRIPGDES